MGEALKGWWWARTPRERRLIAVMGLLALIVLGWLLVVRPLGDALADAKARHGAAVVALAQARTQAAEIERLEKSAAPAAGRPVSTLLGEAAAAAGFPVSRLQEVGGGAVQIAFESARPQPFFDWVARMEGQGLIVVELNARPNADRTLAADVTFRPRST